MRIHTNETRENEVKRGNEYGKQESRIFTFHS